MLKIEHSICPSCSIGCGLNIMSKNYDIIGLHPYTYHKINEGKNCNNCTNFINNLIENKLETADYFKLTTDLQSLLKDKKVTVLTSGNTENNDLEKLIEFTDKNNYNLVSYEYNFTKINKDIIPTYEELENAKTIITIGDIYRINPLLARKIFHAKDNGAKTINVNENSSLTGYNSDEFIKSSLINFINNKIDSLNLNENTIVIINKIDTPENLLKLEEKVSSRNSKLLPLLQHPNSFSTIEKTNTKTIEELDKVFNDTDVLLCVNEDPIDYMSLDKYNFDIISITPMNNNVTPLSKIIIPVKSWSEKEGSFTNSTGLKQEFIDTINNHDSTLKTVTELLEEINKML